MEGPEATAEPNVSGWAAGTLRSNRHEFIMFDLAFTKYKPDGDAKCILQVPNFNVNVNQLKKFLRKIRTIKVSKNKSYEKIQKRWPMFGF